MTPPPISWLWLQWALLLAIEISAVWLVAALAQSWILSAAWRRTLWQAAIIAVLGITLFEISGSARKFAAWTLGSTAHAPNHAEPIRSATGLRVEPSAPALHLDDGFRKRIESTLALNREAAAHTLAAKPFKPSEQTPQGTSPGVVLESQLQPVSPSNRLNTEAGIQPTEIKPNIEHNRPLARTEDRDSFRPVLIASLCCAWVLGFLFLAARTVATHGLLMIFRRRHSSADAALLERVERLAANLGMRLKIRVLQSAALSGPIAFGWFRPTIALPLSFSESTEPLRQDAMLAHELAHLAARDPLWHLLADVTAALLWWHPAAWWTRRRLHLASEAAADEASLLVQNGPRELAECLVELGKRLSRPEPIGGLGVMGYRSHLGRRVQALLHLEGRSWKPPGRLGAVMARSIGPLAVAALVIMCSAWAAPQALTKGENMKTLQQSWRSSLATLVLLATVNAAEVPAADVPRPPVPAPVIPSPPGYAPAPVIPSPPGYGDSEPGVPGMTGSAMAPGQRSNPALAAKLESIVLDEVSFDGLPLSEVLRVLNDEARKRDPEKKGINFLLNPNQPPSPTIKFGRPPAIDPTTGLPVPSAPPEAIDISQVQVRFNLPLRRVTMKNLLAAIVKVADHPIDYSLEDYGVVFSLRPEAAFAQYAPAQPVLGAHVQPFLQVATFRVDTNSFIPGLASAFGIKLDLSAPGEQRSSKIKTALRELLTQLGISMEGQKAIFYNELTGILMVRATGPDLMVVEAAIQTLGGNVTGGNSLTGAGGAMQPGSPGIY